MKRAAIIITSRTRDHEDFNDLPAVDNDGQLMYSLFESAGYSMVPLRDESAERLKECVKSMAKQMDPGGLLIIYYGGHGHQIHGRDVIICPKASRKLLETFDEVVQVEFLRQATDIRGLHRVLILDCCRDSPYRRLKRGAEGFEGSKSEQSLRDIVRKDAGRDHASDAGASFHVIWGCSQDQVAPEIRSLRHGLFTAAFTDVIKSRRTHAPVHLNEDLCRDVTQRMAALAQEHALEDRPTPCHESSGEPPLILDGPPPKPPALAEAKSYSASVLAECRHAAEQGDADAQLKLAQKFQYGWDVEQNWSEAASWYRKAAEQGLVAAQLCLADCFERGAGVKESASEATMWYRKAAQQGDSGAQCSLGHRLEWGKGVKKNVIEAAQWYRKAAEQGHFSAQYHLAECLEKGQGVKKNTADALKWYAAAAKQGNLHATRAVQRIEVEQKLSKPRRIARRFVSWAKNNVLEVLLVMVISTGDMLIAYMLIQGPAGGSSARDVSATRAMTLREKAAIGDANAQYELAESCANGSLSDAGIEQSWTEAANWYRKAANQGLAKAQFELGYCYDRGAGVDKDLVEAVAWYRKAAEQGHGLAQDFLGESYERGKGVEMDVSEAVKWYRRAANQGSNSGEMDLARCYENGIGVERSVPDALNWYRKAAKGGDLEAIAAVKRLGG